MRGEAPGIEGDCDPAFAEVRAEFERNFAERGEVGAACAIEVDGRPVVDLWGGIADPRRRRPWTRDTLVMVYSTTKGAAATTVALARSRGLIDYDERVARYWPEFGRNGKEDVTVRQLLAHQAGLPAIAARLDAKVLADADRLAAALADERPAWKPGTRHGYHALSIGWYESALLRRVDASGRGVGAYFADEIAGPLGLDFHIPLPDGVPGERLARLVSTSPLGLLDRDTLPGRFLLAMAWPGSLASRTFRNPRLRGPIDLAKPEYRPVEIPAGGGWGTARSLARMYGDLSTGAPAIGLDAETLAALSAPPRPPSGGGYDLVLHLETSYALGFVRPSGSLPWGHDGAAFGHPGAGGSFAFADPAARVGFAYTPNRLGWHLHDDPRERALRDALYRCLG